MMFTVLVPNILYGAGQGAAIPIIPLAAIALTGSPAMAAVVAAMLTLGQLPLMLPAGWLVIRFGERPAMLGSTVATGAGAVAAYLAPSLPVLAGGAFLIGGGVAVFTTARHAWITTAVPPAVRGRSLSALAGSMRLGMFAGPFLAAAAVQILGDVRGGFCAVMATSVLLAVLVAIVGLPDERDEDDAGREPDRRVLRTMWERRDVLLTLGLSFSVVSTLRNTRRILVPLAGAAVGFDDVTVALVMGLASGLDFSLFYLGGLVTDRFGRLAVAVPALIAFGLSHAGLALATQVPGGAGWYLASTAVMALANGWSGGVVATVGSDLADPRAPAPFLSAWRLTTELGSSVAPFAVAALVGVLSLPVACVAFGGLAGAGALILPSAARRHLTNPPR